MTQMVTPKPLSAVPAARPLGQTDMFLKITGVHQGWIKGESQDAAHNGEINIESYSWSVKQGRDPSNIQSGGRKEFGQLVFQMRSQLSTPKLLTAITKGEVLTTVVLTCRKAGGQQQEYMKWTLTNATLTVMDTGYLAPGEIVPYDCLQLTFQTIQLEYKPQNANGSLGASILYSGNWNSA